MRRGLPRSEPVRNGLVGVDVGIEVEKRSLPLTCQRRVGADEPLDDATRDAVVAADRDGTRPGLRDPTKESGDPLDAALVVVRLGERNVTEVVDRAGFPGREAERRVVAALERRHVPDGARAEVLISLRGSVPRRVRHTDERDVARLGVRIDGAPKQRRNAPPVEALDHHPVARVELVGSHGAHTLAGMGDRGICSELSLGLGEPLLATASEVTSWLLVEQPGPWGRKAVVESRLDRHVAETLDARAKAAGVRVLLVKRPDRDAHGRRCWLGSSRQGKSFLHELEVSEPADLLALDVESLGQGDRPAGRPVERPVYLVCTNSRRDACCARLGRPAASALAAIRPDDTWECSHVGGHRFAANVVCLPEGLWYGRVTPDAVEELVAAHEARRLVRTSLRGRSSLPVAAQAADAFLRERLALDGIDDVVVERADATSVASPCPVGRLPGRGRVSRCRAGQDHVVCGRRSRPPGGLGAGAHHAPSERHAWRSLIRPPVRSTALA